MSEKVKRNRNKHTFLNKTVAKKDLGKLISNVHENFGNAIAATLGNNLKNLGFMYATRAAVTLSIDDLSVPPAKKEYIKAAEDELTVTSERFERGEITEVERYNKVIDTWSETNEKITDAVVDNFDRLNPVYMMAFSGARGNISQVRQLVGMRGLMADSEGKIIDLPIKSNFREGLSVTEYIISAYGARKGLVDTALKTADSGYLTRRLVDVAQDVIIRTEDCGTKKFITMGPLMDGEKVAIGISARIFGRVAAEDIVNPETKEVIVKKGQAIKGAQSEEIEELGINEVKIRSALVCEAKHGVCKQCYGWSTTDNKPSSLGDAIGIIAAQSIGEPGTQLTMRTFHTGGAVAGAGKSRDTYNAPCEGEVSYSLGEKEVRTKYGEIMFQVAKNGKMKIGSKTLSISVGSLLSVKTGDIVKEGQELGYAVEQTKTKVLTEKASKDLITPIAGIVKFEEFGVDETTDRQGNISKLVSKQGTIWVHGGEVLPLPPGAEVIVKNDQVVKAGDTLSEILVTCEHGGEVRYGQDILVEKTDVGSRTINKLSRGRLVNVINASIGFANAKIQKTQQGNVLVLNDESEKYVLKVVNGEIIENGKILCELVDDAETPTVTSSGEIRYMEGLEVDEDKIVTASGKVVFIPEEMHMISKDSSLLNCQTGDYVKAGDEIVKDVFATINGIVSVVIENNIVHEVTIIPGELHDIADMGDLQFKDGEIVKKGAEVLPGVKAKKPSMVTLFINEETGETKLLLREVQYFDIEPREVKFEAETTDAGISILPVTQMIYRNGDKVRNINGGSLTRTSLILYAQGDYKEAQGLIEFTRKDEFNVVFQENIILRSDRGDSTITELLVNPGDFLKPGGAVARTQTITKSDGTVHINEEDATRIMITTEKDTFKVECSANPKVKEGQYVRAGDKFDKSTVLEESGLVLAVNGKTITLQKTRPFLVSYGTRLHVDNNSLVQQGDQLATIIYEKIKTGDIVQGLPKVEELLEGRKPKEPAMLAEADGVAEIVAQDGIESLFIQTQDSKVELPIPPGQNIIVANGEEVKRGQVVTDGQPNPHEILEYWGVAPVQQFLVDEVQAVYNSQGVEIANKHIEVIVRQMTSKIRVDDPGDTELLQGELQDMNYFEKINKVVVEAGGQPALGTPILLGLTKASLNTDSFISAASFQETTRILAEASIKGKTDWLRGLKENVIIGRLIPAGTGFDFDVDSDEALIDLDRSSVNVEDLTLASN